MCLILFGWQAHARYSLVVAANRDEFHARPTAAADYWSEAPDLLAGRDLQAGGTWLGITRSGRFAAITNYREPDAPEPQLGRSRGELVRDFLAGSAEPGIVAATLAARGPDYRGFNLLLGTPEELLYAANRGSRQGPVNPGCHGLSNHLLDTEWPKVRSGRARLQTLLEADRLESEALLELLTDRSLTPGTTPGDVEPGLVQEQLANHYFIVSPVYGTRSSTVLLLERDGRAEFVERRYAPDGSETGTSRFVFDLGSEE
jgi:uncharacterized protein with NRDE domain